jgi:hypothetical protein
MAYEAESPLVGGNPNDTPQSSDLIGIKQKMQGSLSAAQDTDYFKVVIDAPGLLAVSFDGGDPKRLVKSWQIDVLDANFDLVRTLSRTVNGTLSASVPNANDAKTIEVSGQTSAIKVGARLTAVSDNSDASVYSIRDATGLVAGKQTLVLDSAWVGNVTSIQLDPASLEAAGGVSTINADIPKAGTYYVKVSAIAFTDAEYSLNLGFSSAEETSLNNTRAQAVSENSRLVPELLHQGTVSTTDSDVWLVSTAKSGNFKLDFSAGSSDATTAFDLKVESWTKTANGVDVLTPVVSRSGSSVSGPVTGTKSIEISSAAYPEATSFVVTVSAKTIAGGGTGSYRLKASGTGLDINDAPLITVGDTTSGLPDALLNLSGEVDVAVGAGKQFSLGGLFSATDADSQSLKYQFKLAPSSGSAASGSITYKDVQGNSKTYTFNSDAPYLNLTEKELASAYVLAGPTTGSLQLDIQAFDSSNSPDNSGYSSLVRLKVRVVSANAGVNVITDDDLKITEGVSAGSDGYEETLSFSLKEAPLANENVTLSLLDPEKQLVLDKSKLTFTSANFSTAQTVKVRALKDGRLEGDHSAKLTFAVSSNLATSNYSGQQIDALTFSVADPSNTAASGAVTIDGKATQGETLAANTSGISDADGVGSFIYQWQRTSDGTTWTDIGNSSSRTYLLAPADSNRQVRVVASFVDGKGNLEEFSSASTAKIVTVNVPPSSLDSEVSVLPVDGFEYRFKLADFPFVDTNPDDTLAAITLSGYPLGSILQLDGKTLTGSSTGLTRTDVSKLGLKVPADKTTGDNLVSFKFSVTDNNGATSNSYNLTVVKGDQNTVHLMPSTVFEATAFSTTTEPIDGTARMTESVGLDISGVIATGKQSADISLVVLNDLRATGYWVKDDADDFWTNLASEVSTQNGLTTLKVSLKDNGIGDSDPTLGVIDQSGLIADMPLSIVGVPPDATAASEQFQWF